MKTKNWIRFGLVGTAIMAMVGCNGNDLTRSASPVALIASTTQNLHTIDIVGGTGCNQSLATINLQAVIKNPAAGSTNSTFDQVRVSSYQVSYVRTDGGKQVPAPIVVSTDVLLTPGGSAVPLGTVIQVTADALKQAPFQALNPANGGRDPDTGKSTISMDLITTIFGETLAGDKVSAQAKAAVTFCYNCGGCS